MNFLQKSFSIATVVLAACRASGGEDHPLATNAPPCIQLHDQYDAPQKLSFPSTNITVLTIADKKGSDQVDGWIAALKPRYAGRIKILGIADVGGAPVLVHGKIRKKFQETRPYPVMMDWSGKVCAQLSYKPDVANILVIGRDGAILGRFSGLANVPKLAEACSLLDRVLSHTQPIKKDKKTTTP